MTFPPTDERVFQRESVLPSTELVGNRRIDTDPSLHTKPILAILVAIVIVNLIARYPYADNLAGVDTFYETGLARSVTQLGRAVWTTNALSYFGYPSSEPPAVPILLSGLSGVAGIEITATNYLFTSVLALVGALGAFCLALRLRRDYVFALIVAIAFSLGPRYMSLTVNQSSTRDLLIALTPIALYCVFQVFHQSRRRWTWIALAEVMFVLILASHHAGILFLPVAFAVAIAAPIAAYLTVLRVPPWVRVPAYALLFLGLFMVQVLRLGPSWIALQNQYTTGRFFSGRSPLVIFANFGIDFASGFGALSPLVLVGIVVALRRSKIRAGELFPLLSLLLLAPALVIGFYVYLILLAPLCLLAGVGFNAMRVNFASSWKRKAVALGLATAVTIASASFMLAIWGAGQRELQPETYDVALYLKAQGTNPFAATDPLVKSYQIWTVSGRPPLSPSTTPLLVYGILPPDQVAGSDPRSVWGQIRYGDIRSPVIQHLLLQYEIDSYVEVSSMGDTSVFRQSLSEAGYVTFTNSAYIVWQV